MSIILSIETSTTVCSVAVHNESTLLAFAEVHREQSHASKLAGLIKEVISLADIEMQSVNAVAVSEGPGSYTGLRIGASTAKGLCYALSIPLLAIGTLDLLAAQVGRVNLGRAWLCPMIDARRVEVYCLLTDADYTVINPVEARIIDEQSFVEELSTQTIIFFGNGAMKCSELIRHPNALFLEGVTPSAVDLGPLAWKKYREETFEDIVHFEPFYLKEFRIKKPAYLKDAVSNKIG